MRQFPQIVRAFIGAAGVLMAVTAAHAVDLTYGSYYPPQHLIHEYGIRPANDALKGKIRFEIVAGGQLFSAATALKGIGTGIADAGSIVNAYTRSQLKHAVSTTDLTFISNNPLAADGAAHETYFLNCPECLEDFKRSGTIFLAGATSAGYSLMCRDKVTSLDEVKGKKIRTAGAMGRLAQAMGGTAVSMSTSDMVEALSRGQIDCIMGPLAWLKSYPIADVVTHIFNFDIGAFNSVASLLMNRNSWDKLSAENKKALWNASPGIAARATLQGYNGEFLDSIELVKKHKIVFTGPNDATREFARKHRINELQAVKDGLKKLGVSDSDRLVQAFVTNLEKWEKIIAEAGLEKASVSPSSKADLDKVVPVYAELLRKHVYDKVDINKL